MQCGAYAGGEEARATRLRSRVSTERRPHETDLHLAEELRRLKEEKDRLEEELKRLEGTAVVRKADLLCQIDWHELQIEAVRRQRQRNRGFGTALEY